MSDYVLVIDDDDDMLCLMTDMLHMLGFKARRARDGSEGLACVRHDPPRAIVMDLCMPGMDGWELATQLRNELEVYKVPIVVVTGFPDADRLAGSLNVPVGQIVEKNGSLAVMVTSLRKALEGALDSAPVPASAAPA